MGSGAPGGIVSQVELPTSSLRGTYENGERVFGKESAGQIQTDPLLILLFFDFLLPHTAN